MKLLQTHITSQLKHSLRLWMLILNLSLGSFITLAQNYPVQVSINATGPFYNYLPYYSDQNNHLQIIAILTDFNTSDINVKLRLHIEGPGYELRTNPNFQGGNTFLLSSGMPEYIQGMDLAPLLTNSSLIKQPNSFDLNNLPEGFTTICVDIIKDGPSGEVLSTNNCFSFFLQKLQPPTPQLPFCETQLDPQLGFYTFQWSPPVGYTPTINSQVEYEFELYEWVDQSNYNIFQTGQGLVYTEVTEQPLIQLSSYDVLLQEGLHYVWRVKATVLDNGMPVQMIEQGGISAPCSFQFGQAQTLEESLAEGLEINLTAQGLSERKGRAAWTVLDNTPGEGLSTYSSYIVEYRKKPTGNEGYEFSWFQDTVPVLSKDIFQLEPSTTYECKVYGRVGSFTSEPTEVVEFTTPQPRVYACGDQDLPFRSPNYVPLEFAEAGMKVEIGQFMMQLSEVQASGASGRYSGKGTIAIDFLLGAKAKVTFDDILIDNQFVVREGRVDVMTDGVDAWLHEQYKQFIDPIYVSGNVDDITVDTTAGTGWVYFNGDSLAFAFDPPDYPVIIHDDEGNSYTIYPDGRIENGTYFVISSDYLATTADDAVIFKQHETEVFGFDAKAHTKWHAQYEIIQLSDSSKYFVANKSLGVGATDKVIALIPKDLSGITFQKENGEELVFSPFGGGQGGGSSDSSMVAYDVEIPVISSKGEYPIYVYSDNNRIGKLNLHVYEEKEIDVVIVPVVNVTIDSAAVSLAVNNIFNEANIRINISTADQWNNAAFTTTTTIGMPSDVSHFGKYSDDMRDLRDAYFDSVPNADKSKYYLFVVDGFDGGDEDGYMVRGKGVGFVSRTATPLTYAHELGHGAGALEHTWNKNGPDQGTTDNLMDYAGGNNLTSGQWKELRKLRLVPSFWDSEEDGMMRLPKSIDTLKLIGEYCEQDIKCYMKKYFKIGGVISNELRSNDSVHVYFYEDSSLSMLNSSYIWKRSISNQWTELSINSNSSRLIIISNKDTAFCDGRTTSYCKDSVYIPPPPPKINSYAIYVTFPEALAAPGINDKRPEAITYRIMFGERKIQVGHTGICLIKPDTINYDYKDTNVTKIKGVIDYFDFGRFKSPYIDGVSRHFPLDSINLIYDPSDSTFKIESWSEIGGMINNIPYFADHLNTYNLKEQAIIPIHDYEGAYSLANSSFYENLSFGFGDKKSFCTDYVHDILQAGGIMEINFGGRNVIDISGVTGTLSYRLEVGNILKDIRDNFNNGLWDLKILKYIDHPHFDELRKQPLPINIARNLRIKYYEFN